MKKRNLKTVLFLMALVMGILSSGSGFAHEDDPHQGIFMGVNLGGGHSFFGFNEGPRQIIDEGNEGGMGGLRFGYSISKSFALSLEGFGFGQDDRDDNEEEWGFGAGLLAATWHPGGQGFFMRAGAGVGGGEFLHPDNETRIELRERAAFLFSMGFDFHLNNSLTLGISLDSMVLDAGNTIGPGDDFLGAHALTLQFNWYL